MINVSIPLGPPLKSATSVSGGVLPTAPVAPVNDAAGWSLLAPVAAPQAAPQTLGADPGWNLLTPVADPNAAPAEASPGAPSIMGSIGTFANHLVTDIPVVGPIIQGATDWGIGAIQSPFTSVSPGDFVKHEQDYRASQTDANPVAAAAGNALGNVGAATLLGGTTLGAEALGFAGDLVPKMFNSAASYTGETAADNMVRYGQDPMTATVNALTQGPTIPGINLTVPGPLVAAVLPAAAHGFQKAAQVATTSPVARAVMRQLQADRIDPASIPQRTAAMGDGATIADLGPNLQRKAASIATQPGEGQQVIVDAMMARQAAAADRVPQALNNIAGPEPVPSRVTGAVQDAKDALQPYYQQELSNWAADPHAQPLAMQPLADKIDTMVNNAKGPTATALERVRSMLDMRNARGTLDPRPEGLMATRRAIDGMLDGETNTDIIRNLTQARAAIDDTLSASIPGVKAIDARYAELARLGSDFETGRSALNTGGQTGSAMHPDDLAPMMQNTAQNTGRFIGPANGASAGPRFIAGGMLSKIYEVVGNNSNDRVALKKILTGEGKWNYQKIASAFGEDKAQQLLDLFRNESTMAETENLALHGSKTAALTAAHAEDAAAANRPGVIKSLLNFRAGDIYDAAKEKLLGTMFADQQAAHNALVARAVMGNRLNGSVLRDVHRLAAPAVITPALQRVAQAALMSQARLGYQGQ